MEPTLNDPHLRTYQNVNASATDPGYDQTRSFPWRSPGHSPVFSPCGISGGGPIEHPANGAFSVFFKQGTDGLDVPEGPKTVWRAGSEQEVAWAIT